MAGPDPPPLQRFRWDWREFTFAVVTNTLGGVLALFIGYLAAVLADVLTFDWRAIILPALVLLPVLVYAVYAATRVSSLITEAPKDRDGDPAG